MQVYDLAWSPTGEYIIAGSTDNCARIFSTSDGECRALVIMCGTCVDSGLTNIPQANVCGRSRNTTTTCKALHGIR